MMKNLFYAGCCFFGYSLFQILGFVSKAFPESRVGAIALITLGLLIILVIGVTNWCGLYYKRNGVLDRTQSIVGFAPTFVFGTFALFAVMVGIYAAQ
ncbi:hypothetical protein [uncultured Nostoc sp.]|uniref:hypothetical protein n=1 Tax=uncultured Nostoc sp. TaxID=340711 RepID=UPI0035CB66D0